MQLGIPALLVVAAYALLVISASAGAFSGYRMFRPLASATDDPGENRSVSVIIAAKEEADTLGESLASLSRLDRKPKEVIVVCGPSNDGTQEVAQKSPGVTVLREPPRPADWVGKSWALHEGYLRSTGDILLFADGDVLHSPGSLDVALANLESSHADLLSVWPQIITRVLSERVILPTSIFFLCAGIAASATKSTPRGKRINGANGQYIMITRAAYEAIGGHAAIKGDIMEDGAIGRRALSHGLEVINSNGQGVLEVKPYARFEEVWEAHERFGAGLIPSTRVLVAASIVTLAFFVGPFLLLAAALATASWTLGIAAGCMCALVYATQAFFSRKTSSVRYSLLAPLSGLLVIAAFVTGFVRFRRGGVTWKGVKYASDRFKPL